MRGTSIRSGSNVIWTAGRGYIWSFCVLYLACGASGSIASSYDVIFVVVVDFCESRIIPHCVHLFSLRFEEAPTINQVNVFNKFCAAFFNEHPGEVIGKYWSDWS